MTTPLSPAKWILPIILDLHEDNKCSAFIVIKLVSPHPNDAQIHIVIAFGAVGYPLVEIVNTSHDIHNIKFAGLHLLMKNRSEFATLR